MIFLAIRYLIERKRQTLLTFLGVFLGTMAYVAVSGFFLGFHVFIVEQLVNNAAQIHIQARKDYLSAHQLDQAFYENSYRHVFWYFPPSGNLGYLEVQDPQSWYERLARDPRVEAYSPLLTTAALFSLSKISVSAVLIGCNPIQQQKVTSIADYVVDGHFRDLAVGGNRVILGDELMKRLGVGINQTVRVSVGTGNASPFKVVGRYYTGNRFADSQAYAAINDVQRLNGTPNQVNEIGVRLKDYRQAAAIATNWSRIAPERTESWDQQNANILSVFRIQDALRFSMIATVVIVAGFGIYNVLNMTVNQKRQDIAILRSMGYDTFDVVMLFFSQGLILGVLGGACGLFAGYFFCRYLQTIPFMPAAPGNPQGYLHISLDSAIYIQAALVALISSSLASILPARAAGRLTPIDIIRAGG
ncbi:ABC transporter permease [Bdellovibrio svalbardensis]|uniref:ABC transporter permease n=1 Tax=Bdellovibrio svalbardensis TaxID=2972972 RepID=A0ABT6DLC4_9BACT|nr:ABC transporter permease [Bdellovibrio svalbardensis]MDG0817677.1 ABC transporter permease [Bdellovibrio svalbardensis]